ncbi:MAG: phosphomannomutase/phosphoglucomutase [bacterium]|nr:phosphomannomutase/phosphoglucomutase [bacterium]
MNYKCFRAYDIRGVYKTDLDEEAFYRIAKGYTLVVKPKGAVVVGMDARVSSPVLKAKVVEALRDCGVDVIDVGEITTDMIYYAVGALGHSGGIIISASHNPGEYNGMKMVREKAAAISSDTGLFDIRDALKAGKDKEIPMPSEKGSYTEIDVLDDYVKHVLTFVDQSVVKKFKFVANGNFGYVGKPMRKIAEILEQDMVELNFEPDGTFPKGPPDPMLAVNRVEIEPMVKNSDAQFGVAWDADADRVMFVDENGDFISGAYVTALLAEILLKKYGSDNEIIFDPRVIWPATKAVERLGGKAVVSKSGHTFMKDRMRTDNALFAGEMSAHYYFRDNYYADNGVIPFLLILEYLSTENKTFSEMMAPYMEGHYMTGELNFKVRDIKQVLAKVRERFGSRGKENDIDGFSFDSDEWRFNIRPSNTEPLLRLNIEAKKDGLVEELKKEIEEIINS